MIALLVRSRTCLLAAAAALCWLGAGAGAASAASETVNCAGLQAALNQAQNGNIITLDQLCTSSNSAGHFSIPNSSAVSFMLTGKGGSGAGFDGTGVSQSLLSSGFSSNLVTIVITNLTFRNDTAGTAPYGGGAIFLNGRYNLILGHDTFTNNGSSSLNGGGAIVLFDSASSGSISIAHSAFSGNTAALSGGAVEIEESPPANNQIPIALSYDTFATNTLQGGSSSNGLLGGAVAILNENNGQSTVTQTGNRFSGNSIAGGTADANGGAEGMFGMNLHSTGDVFTGNSLRAAPSGFNSEGAALSIENNNCNNNSSLVLQHALTNAVIAGNSITDGGAAGSAHGALYLGCSEGVGGNNLTVNNSTVSGNTGGGGTAGIWGDPTDQLTLNNSIVDGDSDGVELTGFAGIGGSVTATFTDLCNGASPFTGTGNICASPALVNATAGNVRETYSSPTIDTGSNSLVPGGVTKDVFGLARIQAKLKGATPVVDMGAAEFPTVGAPLVTITTPASGAVFKVGQAVHSSFKCAEAAGGPGVASCKDGNGRSSGALINTSTTGRHTFKAIAISTDGLRTTKTVTYTVNR